MAAVTSIFESSTSEQRWITQISKMLENEVKIEITDVPVSIFRVPTTMSSLKKEAYEPQLVGLGPYHRFRPELYEMEKYKIAAATRVQKRFFPGLEFKQLVDKLAEIDYEVRACYHKYLDIDGETLAWIMAIDGLFLLEFLRSYAGKRAGLFVSGSSLSTGHLVDAAGKSLAHDAILGDIAMLENQIPTFLLSKIMSVVYSLPDASDNYNPLPSMLMGFCRAISPLKLKEDISLSTVLDHAHLLDLLYHLTVPNLVEEEKEEEEPQDPAAGNGKEGSTSFGSKPSSDSGDYYQIFTKLLTLLSRLNVGFLRKFTKPIKVIIGVPWNYISTLPGCSTLASYYKKEIIKPESENPNDQEDGKKSTIPVVEEIMIPSVSNLRDAGVEFCPTAGDITTIKFDEKTLKFYLPVVTLNVNSEVVMRNLVAYEASIVSESLVFARYTELMNGIIDTAEDVKVLREKKIIVNSLKSDAEVAQVFNGMSKSVRLTNVAYIDRAIEGANRYFNSTKKIRVYRCMKKYVYGSWKILTVVAVVLLILMMILESFCSVYSCTRFFDTTS